MTRRSTMSYDTASSHAHFGTSVFCGEDRDPAKTRWHLFQSMANPKFSLQIKILKFTVNSKENVINIECAAFLFLYTKN